METRSFQMEYAYPKEMEIAKKERWPILIPIGTMEYHSTICPYGCDSLVSMGIAREIAKEMDCVIMPPVWYGVASYAVGGPETGTIQVDCDTFEQYVYMILKSLFLAGFNRNIYMIVAHQTEDYNPMELACMKAARKLVFEYLDNTKGYGWWGKNENKEFYQQMSAEDNPWNWVKTIRSFSANAKAIYGGGDHAGKVECSVMEYMYPGSIKMERLCETDDWFAQASAEMSAELGEKRVKQSVSDYVAEMKAQKGMK